MRLTWLALCAALLLGAPVAAATVTVELTDFDVSSDGSDPVTNGFSYQQSLAYASSEALYLHDDWGVTSSTIRSVAGHRFDAVDADIRAYTNVYVSGPGRPDGSSEWYYDRKLAFDNFAWFGYRDGEVVAKHRGSMDTPWDEGFREFRFSDDFHDLDALEARLLLPNAEKWYFPEFTEPNTVWCEEWCGGFQVDRLALRVENTPTPVPLPPAGTLLLGGLGALAVWRRLGRAFQV
jgi:hypothetical protein